MSSICNAGFQVLIAVLNQRIIEECYGDRVCETEKYGPVLTKAEYVYGDSVANYTPIYVKVGDILDICTIEELATKYGNGQWVRCLEKGKQEKEKKKLEGTSQQKNPTQIGVFISGAIKQYHKKNQGNQDVKSIGG